MRRVSRFLSWALRHSPEQAGIRLDSAGWASVDDVLAACAHHGVACTAAQLEQVVRTNDKQRFELADGRIRAVQGHSVAVALDHPVREPPEHLFHGTVARFLPSIRQSGLVPGGRHAVHLSADQATAQAVGARRGAPVVLVVRAGDLSRTGAVFRQSPNGVWLVEHVPAAFLDYPGGKTKG